MRTRSSLALFVALTTACIEPQMHGPRADGGAADGGTIEADGGTIETDGGSIETDGGTIEADGGTIETDGGTVAPPPHLEITLAANAIVDVVFRDGSLVPAITTNHTVTVVSTSGFGTYTTSPRGTIGGCDLFPPIGTTTWPPGEYVEPTPVPLPLEYVSITADGVPLETTLAGTHSVRARAQLAVGARVVATVSYPGHAPIRREFLVESVPALTAPEVQPSVDRVVRGTYVEGTDLTIAWEATDRDDARQILDLGGSAGAARCDLLPGDRSLTQAAADVRDRLLGSAPSLSVQLHALTYEDETVGTTVVRRSRWWSTPSALLDVTR